MGSHPQHLETGSSTNVARNNLGTDDVLRSSLKPSRVLCLANSAQFGGGNRALLTLANGLREHQIGVEVTCPGHGPMESICAEQGIRSNVIAYQQPSWSDPAATFGSYRIWLKHISQSSCDLIHANDLENARSICVAAWRADVPLVCHVHFPPSREYAEWAFRRLPSPSAFVFNSQNTQDLVSDILQRRCPRSSQVVIHNAVEIDRFHPQSSEPRSTPRVGIIANLLPVKGHHDFLEMAAKLVQAGVSAEFQVIGEDIYSTGYRQELESQSKSLGLGDSVRFLGHCDNVPDLISQLDVIVCSSHAEPFGLCLIEGMASEKPIVATRVGGIPEVVDDGVTGILVQPRSPTELAEAVNSLLADRELRDAMGRAGRDRVLRFFTPESHVARMLEVYQRCLACYV